VLFGFHVARQRNFPGLVTTPYGQVQDYAFSLRHEDCDILIYGDSSAMTSADPTIIEARTHLKTCNISQTQPTVLVTGMLPVELYLKQNKLPKYLVLQLAPEAFFQSHEMDKTAAFDPITLMLRHDQGAATTKKMLEYPIQALQYVSLVLQDRYHPNKASAASFAASYSQSINDYLARRGVLTLPKPPQKICDSPKTLGAADVAWTDDARRHYSAAGVKVLVTVSPIPDCDTQIEQYRQTLTTHLDEGVSTLPIAMFNDSDRHFTPEGARQVSESVAAEILRTQAAH
jgi:hypothetical protein